MTHFPIFDNIIIPGDKSISHRAIILSSIQNGVTRISRLCLGDDVMRTVNAMRALGVKIELENDTAIVYGVGLHGLKPSHNPIDCGNAGTAMRLLCGLLSAQKFDSVLIGDDSLSKRPMLRVAEPLRLMGANIALSEKNTAPIKITGNPALKAIDYELMIPSAQVKSAILLAGLYTQKSEPSPCPSPLSTRERGRTIVKSPLFKDSLINIATKDSLIKIAAKVSLIKLLKDSLTNIATKVSSINMTATARPLALVLKGEGEGFPEKTVVREKIKTRDHTEKMIRWFEKMRCDESRLYEIPGDISSAAFFIVLATITKNSDFILKNIGINPHRIGIITILKLMGADMTIFNERLFGEEPVADIRIKYAPLHGIVIPENIIASAIDEFPIIFIAASLAKGKTILKNAKELRVKESDRLAVMCDGLKKCGVILEEYDDGVAITGVEKLQGATIDAHHDHRIAMSFLIANHVAENKISIDNGDLIHTSFPNFIETLQKVIHNSP